LYKKGKLKEPNYKPFLDAHINGTEIKWSTFILNMIS
jgi:hypothetical protein